MQVHLFLWCCNASLAFKAWCADLTADRHELINGCTRWRFWLIIMTAVYIPNTDNIISGQAGLEPNKQKVLTSCWDKHYKMDCVSCESQNVPPPCPMMQRWQFYSHNICVYIECTICTSFVIFSKSWDCASLTNATWSYRIHDQSNNNIIWPVRTFSLLNFTTRKCHMSFCHNQIIRKDFFSCSRAVENIARFPGVYWNQL